ncbi:MAG: HD domain-containing phosphohydrolase [Candidatus Omnitrophota bacterium]
MAINYKKELESAAKTMILVHDTQVLIKLIVRMIVHKVKISHAAILLHDTEKDTYVMMVSRGERGLKVPKGFARMDKDNALIQFFSQRLDEKIFEDGVVLYEEAQEFLKRDEIDARQKQMLKDALYQMEIFDSRVAIPSFFRNELLGILLLGRKDNNERFGREELDFFVALASDVAMAIRNAQLFRDLEKELEAKKRLFIHTTIALAAAIDAKDHYTHGHTARVTSLSLEIARKLSERNHGSIDEKFLEHLQFAGLLHDIGKIGVPESILNKNGTLNGEEKKKMQEHAVLGSVILQPIKELETSILGVKYHHERYDGSGYPEGLKGDQIPLVASIISIADSFDAMTTDRPYRKGLTRQEAIDEIRRENGKQFNPVIVKALIELYQENRI